MLTSVACHFSFRCLGFTLFSVVGRIIAFWLEQTEILGVQKVMKRRASIFFVIAMFTPFIAWACSCSNTLPIQSSSPQYQGKVAFTARVVQLTGIIYNLNGKRYSDRALAVVHHRYWGLPWYWPKIVYLDGQYPCDTVMAEGEEHLVSGWPVSYGVVRVSGCSRTRPLASAKVDLRTVDAKHCKGPGGTLIGDVVSAATRTPIANAVVVFRSSDGTSHIASTDADGIYELRHLPPGSYTPVSYPKPLHPEAVGEVREVTIYEGVCSEMTFVAQ